MSLRTPTWMLELNRNILWCQTSQSTSLRNRLRLKASLTPKVAEIRGLDGYYYLELRLLIKYSSKTYLLLLHSGSIGRVRVPKMYSVILSYKVQEVRALKFSASLLSLKRNKLLNNIKTNTHQEPLFSYINLTEYVFPIQRREV